MIESSKDIGSHYMARYTTYTCLVKCINHMLCIHGFETSFYTLSYVKEEVSMYLYSYLTSPIQIQHIYLHPRGIQATHFNLTLQ
jgi:hypothetical protein